MVNSLPTDQPSALMHLAADEEAKSLPRRHARQRPQSAPAPGIRDNIKSALIKLRPTSATLAPVARGAAARGWSGVVGALSKASVPLDFKDGGGWTPAHHAAREGQAVTLAKLAQCGAALDQRLPDRSGRTPAHVAAVKGQAAAIEALCRADVRLMTSQDSQGFTPAMIAAKHGHCNVLRVLGRYIDLGAERSSTGNSVAHIAVLNGRAPVLEALASMGFSLDQRNNDGATPAQLAGILAAGSIARASVVRVLQMRGAYTHKVPELWTRQQRAFDKEQNVEPADCVLKPVFRSMGSAASVAYRPGPVARIYKDFYFMTHEEVLAQEQVGKQNVRPESPATVGRADTASRTPTQARQFSAPAARRRSERLKREQARLDEEEEDEFDASNTLYYHDKAKGLIAMDMHDTTFEMAAMKGGVAGHKHIPDEKPKVQHSYTRSRSAANQFD